MCSRDWAYAYMSRQNLCFQERQGFAPVVNPAPVVSDDPKEEED